MVATVESDKELALRYMNKGFEDKANSVYYPPSDGLPLHYYLKGYNAAYKLWDIIPL
jgi:hypothetical protein